MSEGNGRTGRWGFDWTRAKGVVVAIVNYRTGALTVAAIESVVDQVRAIGNSVIVVVDNASSDGSAEVIRAGIESRGWQDVVVFHEAPYNGGFSFGNNLALRVARHAGVEPAYFVLLNPDTRVEPGCIQALLAYMDDNPNVGIAGARILSESGQVLRSSFNFHTIGSEFERAARLGPISRLLAAVAVSYPPPAQAQPTDWVSGACMIVRMQVLRDVGRMDEGFFLYFEETDLCLRARRAGWTCWYVPDARVVHFVSKSTGLDGPGALKRPVPGYWLHSRRRYFEKNHGRVYALAADLAFLFGMGMGRLARTVRGKGGENPPKLLSDFVLTSVQRMLAPQP